MRAKPDVVNGDPRSLVNTNSDLGSCSPLQLAQGPHFIADNGMGSRSALLGPSDVQDGVGEIDLPAQVYKLGRPQAVAEAFYEQLTSSTLFGGAGGRPALSFEASRSIRSSAT